MVNVRNLSKMVLGYGSYGKRKNIIEFGKWIPDLSFENAGRISKTPI